VCETFIVVSVSMCAWCAVRLRDRVTTTDRAATIEALVLGLCAGAAVVLKPNAGLYFPAVLLWLALYRRVPPGALLRPVAIAIAGSIVLPVLTVAWLWHLGLLHDARVAVLDFNRFYVAQGFAPATYALDFSKAVWLRMKTEPLWLAGGIGSVVVLWDLARTRRLPPLAGLAVIWGAAAAFVIVVNGARLFNSYFINAFPPLALLGAWLVFEAARGSRLRRGVVLATAALMVMLLLQRHYPARVFGSASDDFNYLRGRTSEATYLDDFGGYGDRRGYSARANTELARYVREHTTPDDRIFLFGINGAGVYFASDRLPAHRFLRVNFFVETYFPDPAFRLDAVTAELAARAPRYLIFERLNSTSEMGKTVDALQQDPAVVRLLSRYRFETQIEDFTLFRRAD
jgi:hypothetical protein